MAVKISNDFVKEQKPWVKRAMKGRPLYFGLQAQSAKKGKFILSRKPGEVKPAKVKDLTPYEGTGRDKTKADTKNKIPGGASMGVAQGENGTLKLYFERGKAAPAAEQFVKFFITREMKFKLVKKVRISEVDALPVVPEKDNSDDQQPTSDSVEARVRELARRSKAAGGDGYGLPDRLKEVATRIKSNPGKADDDLDEIEFLIGTLERAKELQDQLKSTLGEPGVEKDPAAGIAKRIIQAFGLVKSGDVDKADDELDIAEQSLANLRKAAGLPEAGAPAPDAPDTTEVDDGKAAEFFNDWLEGIKPDLSTLKQAKADELKDISDHVKAVITSIKKKDWTNAADAYRKADALITAAVKANREVKVRASLVNMQAARLAWDKKRKELAKELREVESRIIQAVKENNMSPDAEVEYDVGDVTAKAKKVYTLLDELDEELLDELDDILNDPNPEERDISAAKKILSRYQKAVDGENMKAIVSSGFASPSLHNDMSKTVTVLSKSL